MKTRKSHHPLWHWFGAATLMAGVLGTMTVVAGALVPGSIAFAASSGDTWTLSAEYVTTNGTASSATSLTGTTTTTPTAPVALGPDIGLYASAPSAPSGSDISISAYAPIASGLPAGYILLNNVGNSLGACWQGNYATGNAVACDTISGDHLSTSASSPTTLTNGQPLTGTYMSSFTYWEAWVVFSSSTETIALGSYSSDITFEGSLIVP